MKSAKKRRALYYDIMNHEIVVVNRWHQAQKMCPDLWLHGVVP